MVIERVPAMDYWWSRVKHQLNTDQFTQSAVAHYRRITRSFFRYLQVKSVPLEIVQPSHVLAYLRTQLRSYRRRHHRCPENLANWPRQYTTVIHKLLRLAQGQWPPPSPLRDRLDWFKSRLQEEGRCQSYRFQVQRFLAYLEDHRIEPEAVQQPHLDSYLRYQLRCYRQAQGRHPPNLTNWHRSQTVPVRLFLRWIQGKWPPPVQTDPLVMQVEEYLYGKGLQPNTVKNHLRHCRRFLAYLKIKRIPVETVEPADVACYVHRELMCYRRRHQRLPPKMSRWRNTRVVPVCGLLQMVHGHWPPRSDNEFQLLRLEEKLKADGYSRRTTSHSLSTARHFLGYLKDRKVPIEAVQPSHLNAFLRMRLALYRRQRDCGPKHPAIYKSAVTRPPRMLLRLVQGIWPPIEMPKDDRGAFCQATCHEYGRWLTDVRGLAKHTVESRRATAQEFLNWLGDRAGKEALRGLTVNEIDGYLADRLPGLRRQSQQWIAHSLRGFLRHLYAQGLIARDLAPLVRGPRIYQNEGIPSAVSEKDIRAVLLATRRDRSPVGLRDYAILMLLWKYGLRAGEIAKLRLDDIDWRRGQLQVRHCKTGAESMLPLLPPVGEAVLDYLQHGRPQTDLRQVFLAKNPPLRAFPGGSPISSMVRLRFKRSGIHPAGKRGPHAFRHARAVRLLRTGTSVKTIADILGHRSMQSTGVYLKLATSDLRAIGL